MDKPDKRKRSGQPVTVADVAPGAEGHGHRMGQQWLVPRTRDAQSLWTVGVRADRERDAGTGSKEQEVKKHT